MYDTANITERVILIAAEEEEGQANLDELSLLVKTSGAEEAGRMVQRRESRHPGTYFGKGKVEELKDLIDEVEADAIVCDDELSPAQYRNLADKLSVKILDRTSVILDIFAQRALSAEGRAQVELAQLKYRLSRLSGIGVQLSRQGGRAASGGVGNRGPGEKKLETDRRHIRSRIEHLTRELKEIRANREVLRSKRMKSGLPVVALVGYTNAGKSTLLNTLTDAGVLAEDKLFATLDTVTRKALIPGEEEGTGAEVLFTDTVGFIHKLPHHLIQAFRATLEELCYADIMLHVVDLSAPRYLEQMQVVYETLSDLGCMDKPIITAYNKMDATDSPPSPDPAARKTLAISARTGKNMDMLLREIEGILQTLRLKIRVLIPYTESRWVNRIHETCDIISTLHRDNGTFFEAYASDEIAGQLRAFYVED